MNKSLDSTLSYNELQLCTASFPMGHVILRVRIQEGPQLQNSCIWRNGLVQIEELFKCMIIFYRHDQVVLEEPFIMRESDLHDTVVCTGYYVLMHCSM